MKTPAPTPPRTSSSITTNSGGSSRWRVVSVVFRLAAIALVLVSPWLTPKKRVSRAQSVVYVVDRSASIGDDGLDAANSFVQRAWFDAHGSGTKLGVVAFDGSAEVIAPVGTPDAPTVHMHDGKVTMASDLASAIRLGVAALPREGHRSLVLLTDARPTRGDTMEAVREATDVGVRIDIVPLDGGAPTFPLVVALRPRTTHVAEHQPVALDVDVRADQFFTLLWSRDGTALPPHAEYMRPADSNSDVVKTITLTDPDPPPGVHVYEVKAMSRVAGYGFYAKGAGVAVTKDDPHPEDKPSSIAAISVEGSAHAAVFSSAGDVPPVLKAALTEAGLEALSLPIERASDPSSYTGADLVVLSDVRVSGAANDDSGLTRTAQTGLIDYVQQGGGLLVTGGVFGLAPEYSGTPLARALPVEIEDRGHVEDPPVALAIMLDRSGSMAASVGGGAHTKIELAIEASLAAADVLRPTDQVALGSVDTETHWDVPLGSVERVSELRESVRRVTAGGGGIYVYTAMNDAYKALEPVKTPIRHVIIFSDTNDAEEQFDGCPFDGGMYGGLGGGHASACKGKSAETLAREARAKGITTTVVGIGDEGSKDTPFLRRVAAAAGGRFYLTSEGADLRRIFLSETRVLAQSNLREKKASVSSAGAHPILEGIDATKLPELSAYVESARRSGADTALLINDGATQRPMLATWRYGLGKTGVITTDFQEGWGGAWASSADAAKVLKQTVRFLLRQHGAHRADAEVKIRDRVVEVNIELPPDAPDNAAPTSIEVFAIEKSGASRKLTMRLEQRGPGHFTARGRSGGEPVIIARARDARGALMAEATAQEDRSPELSGVGADTHLADDIARLGDGVVSPATRETLRPTAHPAIELTATWPYALILAAMLIVVDLVLRRFGSKRARRDMRALHERAPIAPFAVRA